jgi:hypothetical protein
MLYVHQISAHAYMHHAVSSTLLSEPFDTIIYAVVGRFDPLYIWSGVIWPVERGINIVAKATAAFAPKFMHPQAK